MKGHLETEQLKSMDYKSLQALAKDMGVSAAGKTEDIIARIATVEVEVDVPEESQLTEKAAVEAARQKEEREKEVAREQEEEAAAGLIKVKATTRFLDKQLNQIKDAGEAYSVSRERAAELVAAGVAEIAR